MIPDWHYQARCAGILNFLTWPVSQTRSTCSQCVVKTECERAGMLPQHLRDADTDQPLTREEFRTQRVGAVIRGINAGQNLRELADDLGVQRKTLRDWLVREDLPELLSALL